MYILKNPSLQGVEGFASMLLYLYTCCSFFRRSVGCGFKHAPQHFDAVPSMFRGMTRVTWSCLYFWAVSVSGDITTESCESSGEDLPSFLQVTVEVNRSWRYDTNSTSFQTTKNLDTNTSRSGPKFWQAQAKTVETGHEATCLLGKNCGVGNLSAKKCLMCQFYAIEFEEVQTDDWMTQHVCIHGWSFE